MSWFEIVLIIEGTIFAVAYLAVGVALVWMDIKYPDGSPFTVIA